MSFDYVPISALIVFSGFLVYRIQRFIRTHRTWELAFFFAAFTAGALFLAGNPETTSRFRTLFYWLLAVFTGLLALEPELVHVCRQFLGRLHRDSAEREKSAIHEIVEAVMSLSATKTGALIAFEKNDTLIPFAQSGVEINADVRKELILTLFFKDNATHDGGLLIRQGRATHCGAVFPLSERRQIENGLGTRHRAALGLSEKTDAVCLVVSEEEGTISLTQGGEICYDIAPKELESRLVHLLTERERITFYPFHYLKHLSVKLAQSNYIQFKKSLSEKIYELVVLCFFAALFAFFALDRMIRLSDFNRPLNLLLTQPWVFVPALLLGVNAMIFLSSRKIAVNGITNDIKMENRFLFLPLLSRKLKREHLKTVTVKREKAGSNLQSLLLFQKKKKTLLLDRSTSSRSLMEYAKKIKDVLFKT